MSATADAEQSFWGRLFKKEHRLRLFAYFLVILFVGIFYGFFKLSENESVQNVFLGLSTELFGAVLIFLLVDFFFGTDENIKIEERFDHLEFLLAKGNKITVSERDTRPDVRALVEDAIEFRSIDYSMSTFLGEFTSDIIQRVKAGARVRFILIKEDSDAYRKAEADRKGSARNTRPAAQICLNQIRDALVDYQGPGGFDYRDMEEKPYASIMLIKTTPGDTILRVVLYSMPESGSTRLGTGRPCIMISKRDDKDLVEFYEQYFADLWNSLPPVEKFDNNQAHEVAQA